MAVLSRVPNTKMQVRDFDDDKLPVILVSLPNSLINSELQLVAIHTISPIPAWRRIYRDRQLDGLIAWAKQQPGPICVIGDLNTTPWSGIFYRMLAAGFADSRIGFGNGSSWPASLGWWGIPIDHLLVRGDCQVLARSILPNAPGSDHRPLVATLRF